MADLFDRFTPRARRVLKLAADEAENLRHPEIGTEHLLLGLLSEGRGLGAVALRQLGPSPDDVRRRLESRLVPGDIPPDGPRGLSPGAKHAIEMAVAEANRFHHDYLGTEHLLLGLVAVEDGIAGRVLRTLGVDADDVRAKIEIIIGHGAVGSSRAAPPPFTPRTKKVMQLAAREAKNLGHSYIGTEHLLLALVREGEGVAAQILVQLGAELPRVRKTLLDLLSTA